MTQRHTVRELAPAIGARVHVRFESILVACTVRDAKSAWGKVRLLIEPVSGDGFQWIELERLAQAPAGKVGA